MEERTILVKSMNVMVSTGYATRCRGEPTLSSSCARGCGVTDSFGGCCGVAYQAGVPKRTATCGTRACSSLSRNCCEWATPCHPSPVCQTAHKDLPRVAG